MADYKILHDAGYNVLAYDLRNFASVTRPAATGWRACTKEWAICSHRAISLANQDVARAHIHDQMVRQR